MKNFINIKDISTKNLRKIIFDAKQRKKKRKKLNTLDVDKDNPLRGKLLVQMFEKSSTRTRLSFYLAIRQLGGGALTLRADELHFAKGESLQDTAKILSTYGNAFMLRTDSDQKLEEFKKHMAIPIINGLSPSSHPTQVLSDVFTVEEIKKKSISKLQICWIGDANNNVITSLIEASIKFSFKLNIACPKQYKPNKTLLNWAKKNKGKIKIFYDSKKAANGSDVIFTDKVVSMNDKVNKKKKLKDLIGFVGAPWTLLVYMINKKSPKNKISNNFFNDKKLIKGILNKLEEFLKIHIENQIDNGADVIQIFDSWAGLIDKKDLADYAYIPTLNLVNFIKSKNVPAICFPRGIKNYKEYSEFVKPDAISIDYEVDPRKIKKEIKIPVQGGLNPNILLSDKETIKKEALNYLNLFKDHPYIFNLGHGVLPETDPMMIDYLVKLVKNY